MNALELVDIVKIFGDGETATHVLRGVTATVARGEFVGLVGPSGRICQALCPARPRKSMKARAASPRSPIPQDPGRENTGSRIPLDLCWRMFTNLSLRIVVTCCSGSVPINRITGIEQMHRSIARTFRTR